MRILGLDFGSKTVGVAVSDGLLLTAQGVETIERKDENKLRKTCARIEELIAEYEVTEIVLGLPKNMDGSEGESAQNARAFAENLSNETGIECVMQDERGTTITAHNFLNTTNTRGKKRKNVVDEVAATIILQDYLDKRKSGLNK